MAKLKSAFTLIELLVVVAIIGTLGAVVIVNISESRYHANYTKALKDMESIAGAARLYATSNNNDYPAGDASIGDASSSTPSGLEKFISAWPKPACTGWYYRWQKTGNLYWVALRNSQKSAMFAYCVNDETCPGLNTANNTHQPIQKVVSREITCNEATTP